MTNLEAIQASYAAANLDEKKRIHEWMRHALTNVPGERAEREARLIARVRELPVSMDILSIAKCLITEGFYSPSTYAGDISRTVTRIRRNGKA